MTEFMSIYVQNSIKLGKVGDAREPHSMNFPSLYEWYPLYHLMHLPWTVWHRAPLYPERQLQVKLFIPSKHVPPFWHGLTKHSLLLISQRVPEYPAKQRHVNAPTPPMQSPFTQGDGEHRLVLMKQLSPVKPVVWHHTNILDDYWQEIVEIKRAKAFLIRLLWYNL